MATIIGEAMTPKAVEAAWPILRANTLRDWRYKGVDGPRWFRIGKRVFYRRSDVEWWLDAQYATSMLARKAS